MNSRPTKIISETAVSWLAGIIAASVGVLLFCTSHSHLFPSGTRLNLGDVGVGEIREQNFPIFNHSSIPIVIVGWIPSCHCIQANFPQSLLPPGKSIEAYVRTTGSTPLGTHAAVIAVQWHYVGDSTIRTDSLIVSAKYVSPLSLSEERLDFGAVSLSDVPTRTLDVRPGNADNKWSSLVITPASDHLSARIQPTPSGLQIQAQINPRGLAIGVWKSSLRIYTLQNGSKRGEAIDVPVVARIEGPFSVNPSVLKFLERSDPSLAFTLTVHSSTVLIRKLRILGNLVQQSKIVISKDGRDAVVTGSLANLASDQIVVGRIPLQINDSPNASLQLSFICYPG